MRILWVSNSRRTPSGYGQQTNLWTPRIKKSGHDVKIFAFYGQEGSPSVDEDGIVTLPRVQDGYGNDVIQAYADYHRADLVISLIDPFVMHPQIWGKLPWASWTPVDSEPVAPANVRSLKAARWVIAMSKFGEKQLNEAGFDPIYVPHGVDTSIFKPGDRGEARRKLGREWEIDLDGKYLVVANSLNVGVPPRKGFYEMLAAFKMFSDVHADALLYIHCESKGRFGVNMREIMTLVDLDPAKVIFPTEQPYLSGFYTAHYLNDVYNAGDVFLHTSHGEGFGIPIVEAQAAGCPVIVPNFSAMTELVMYGEVVERGMKYMRVPGGLGFMVDPQSVMGKLSVVRYFQEHAEATDRRARAHAEIEAQYGLEAVWTHWERALARIEDDLARETRDRETLKTRAVARRDTNGTMIVETAPDGEDTAEVAL